MGEGFKLWRWPFWQKKPMPRMTAEEVEQLVQELCDEPVGHAYYHAQDRYWMVTAYRILREEFDGKKYEDIETITVYVDDETGELDFLV